MSNIFEEAGRTGPKKHKNKQGSRATSANVDVPKKKEKKGRLFNREEDAKIAEMIRRTQEMKRDIDDRVVYLMLQATKAHIDVNKFMNARMHLFAKEFERIKEIQKQIKLIQHGGAPSSTSAHGTDSHHHTSTTPTKSAEKLTQERKGKTRGARKQWIPIQ